MKRVRRAVMIVGGAEDEGDERETRENSDSGEDIKDSDEIERFNLPHKKHRDTKAGV